MVSPSKIKATSTFIDSSILIAAAISARGAARDLILQGLQGRCRLCLSTLVLRETERNLQKKRPSALPSFELFKASMDSFIVDPPLELVQRIAQVIQPKDAPIVAAALHAQTDYLATYDQKHLLSQRDLIETHFGLLVATPDEILAIINR